MPKIKYQEGRFRDDSLELIEECNRLISLYAKQGYSLTLRQLYYRLVATGVLTENSQRVYKNLGALISKARLAGLIDWYGLEDRTRGLRALSHWENPLEVLESARQSFRIDKWQDQPNYVEVWVEKDALVSVIGRACDRWDVPYMSTRGYNSLSEMWYGAMRLKRKAQEGKGVILIHMADHDPSGVDMTRDLEDRLVTFGAWTGVSVDRIALTMAQVQQYDPPAFWAKATDSRSPAYVSQFGHDSWELDALEPTVLDKLLDDTIQQYLDHDIWDATLRVEEDMYRVLDNAIELGQEQDKWPYGWDSADYME